MPSADHIQVKSLHGPASVHLHLPVQSVLHTIRNRAAAYHGKKRSTFLCDRSILYLDETSELGRAMSSRTAENRFPKKLVGTHVQSYRSWVDSSAQQAVLVLFARGVCSVFSKLIWPGQIFCEEPRTFRMFRHCFNVWRTGEGFEPPMRLGSHSNPCELLP